MRVVAHPLPNMMVLEAEPHADARGSFTRLFCRAGLAGLGLPPAAASVTQANLSFTAAAGTLRGLHYQLDPSAETKIVTCVRGAAHDVVLDLRPGSPTYASHVAVELSAVNHRIVVVPEGCAHGFMSLTDDCLLLYFVTAAYDPARERGVRWDDPAFAIPWPRPPAVISPRDAAHPDYDLGPATATAATTITT